MPCLSTLLFIVDLIFYFLSCSPLNMKAHDNRWVFPWNVFTFCLTIHVLFKWDTTLTYRFLCLDNYCFISWYMCGYTLASKFLLKYMKKDISDPNYFKGDNLYYVTGVTFCDLTHSSSFARFTEMFSFQTLSCQSYFSFLWIRFIFLQAIVLFVFLCWLRS